MTCRGAVSQRERLPIAQRSLDLHGPPQALNTLDTDLSAAATSSGMHAEHQLAPKSSSAWASAEKLSTYGTATSMAPTPPERDATTDTSPRWSMCWWVR